MDPVSTDTTPRQDHDQHRMLIGGQLVDAVNGRRLHTTSPFTGRVWAEVPYADTADVDRAVHAAQAAFEGPWAR